MNKISRVLATTAVAALTATSLSACGDSADDDGASVYFLNFKPEQDAAYQQIAKDYTEETGVPVKVVTAASGKYEQTLRTEVSKSDAPTLFQMNGPTGFDTWRDYTSDLSDTEVAKQLNDDVTPLTEDDGSVRGVPFAVEGFGILYNEEILDKYFALPGAAVTSIDQVKNFESLKKLAEDMQAKRGELGIDGTFASTSLASGEDWRWQTHLANGPMHYEFEEVGDPNTADVEFKYNEEFKNLFDLYLHNSTVQPSLAPSKAVSDSMAEFALGKAAMVQNGNWAWSQIADVNGNVVKEDKIKFLPMYMGLPDEEKTGINVGTENYFAVNSKASEEDQQASKDFLDWLFTSEKGKQHVIDDLGFIAPFKNYGENDVPADPLAKQVQAAIADDAVSTIPWDFQYFPSQQFKDLFGGNLAQYAAGNMDWADVVKSFQEDWKAEKKTS